MDCRSTKGIWRPILTNRDLQDSWEKWDVSCQSRGKSDRKNRIRRDFQRRGYAKEAAKAVRDWAFRNTEYPALYSYCKYTNEPSLRTAESIGMHFDCDYPDEANGITHVSVISKEDWLSEIGAEVVNQQKEGLQDGI